MKNNSNLAIFGGNPIRSSKFSSEPMTDNMEVDLVTSLIQKKQFSKFVGSPIEGTIDLLGKKSRELPLENVSANFLGGEYVRKLESLWSDITDADYCISVNSATSGLTTALLALGLEPGSEVITTPFSFTATCAAIVAANCVPIFCDIDPETFCLSPKALDLLITDKTKCVLTVHWCGNVGDLNEISKICRDKDIYLVEDAAQAPSSFYNGNANSKSLDGKAVGTIGDVGVFSFNEPKNIMTGEGGLILTNNKKIAVKSRLIRNHGEAIVDDSFTDEELSNVVGYNFRLTELHAAIAYVQTQKKDRINEIRNDNYRYLSEKLYKEFSNYLTPQKITHIDSYYAYTAAFKWNYKYSGVHRDIVFDALIAEGIPAFKGYHRLMCDHPMFKRKIAFGLKGHPWVDKSVNYKIIDVPNARNIVNKEFLGFLQMGFPNTKQDMDHIINGFHKIIDNLDDLRKYKGASKLLNIGR
jgi:perosamine synthetase